MTHQLKVQLLQPLLMDTIMISVSSQKLESTISSLTKVDTSHQTRKLAANWYIVDGQLICKWNICS
ncbi:MULTISPECIES: hypothetical protein [Nostocales]|uniref:Uncharacterized protein n=3 Tax=Nostocales TaxID=1161 RepID=A0A0C1QP26_9CYAN|nr:hypothetical protein [Tolypothrix bouteillei]KAF3889270.1 hypothetical protein DA73_0400030145 [Tolypothrix bouteillei VB521301]